MPRSPSSTLDALSSPSAGDRLEARVFGEHGSLAGPVQPLVKALTNTVATSLLDIDLTAGALCGGWVDYTVLCTNGTDHESLTARGNFAGVNKAGVFTVATVDVGSASAHSSAVGLVVVSSLVAGTNKVTFKLTATSLLTPTLLQVRFAFAERNGRTVVVL